MTPLQPAPLAFTITLTAEQLEALAERVAAITNDSTGSLTQPEPWLNVDQAADYLACARQRIYNLVSQRRLRHAKDGSRVLFRRQWLDDYLEASS
jgi:excisionase family DNA binding protein